MPEFIPLTLTRQKLKAQGLPVYKHESSAHIYGSAALKLLQKYKGINLSKGLAGFQILQNLAVFGAEYLLVTNGRPYFKIYPEFVAPLADTGLDVPSEYCKLPYESFEIRLPRESPICLHINRKISTIRGTVAVENANVLTMLVYEENSSLVAIVKAMKDFASSHRPDVLDLVEIARNFTEVRAEYARSRQVISSLGLVLNWISPDGAMCNNSLVAVYPLTEAMTLEESVSRHVTRDSDTPTCSLLQETGDALRLSLAVSFLATNHDRLIEPDILNKDLAKFCHPDTDETTRKELHDRATRRRGNEGRGYTLGRRERLLRVAEERNSEVTQEGRFLKHQHQRRGHIHRFHTKTKMIYKWIPQLTVRPDLPVDSDREGSGTVIK